MEIETTKLLLGVTPEKLGFLTPETTTVYRVPTDRIELILAILIVFGETVQDPKEEVQIY